MKIVRQALLSLLVASLFCLGVPAAPPVRAQALTSPCTGADDFLFRVTIENVSDRHGHPTALSPGVWVLAERPGALFERGRHPGVLFRPAQGIRTAGLEALAEDGDPARLSAALAAAGTRHGVFGAPGGADAPSLLQPGERHAFTVDAGAAPRQLILALMAVQSNDWFIGTDEAGIALETPLGGAVAGGEVTDQLRLWDAGTEADEPFGRGAHQAPRQPAPDTGPADADPAVRPVTGPDAPAVAELVRVTVVRVRPTVFDVTLQNTTGRTLPAAALAPGLFHAHAGPDPAADGGAGPLFRVGRPAPANGLEALAEDGDPEALLAHVAAGGDAGTPPRAGSYGRFAVPAGAAAPGPLEPGAQYRFAVRTDPRAPHLSLALMLVESNDWFLATPAGGVNLFGTDGGPFAGTVAMHLYDAGTEADEPFGQGPSQPPRQAAPGTGPADEDPNVRRLGHIDAGDLIAVTVTPRPVRKFRIRLTNVSDGFPLSPGVLVSHGACEPLFTVGAPDRNQGLERLAEDGDPTALARVLAAQGLAVRVLDRPAGAAAPGLLQPGASYEAVLRVDPAEPRLSLAFMHVHANDVFLGGPAGGLRLWDDAGRPVAGDVVAGTVLWDLGTEANEEPCLGRDQPLAGGGPDAGAADPNRAVRPVDDGFAYPQLHHLVRLTVTPADDE